MHSHVVPILLWSALPYSPFGILKCTPMWFLLLSGVHSHVVVNNFWSALPYGPCHFQESTPKWSLTIFQFFFAPTLKNACLYWGPICIDPVPIVLSFCIVNLIKNRESYQQRSLRCYKIIKFYCSARFITIRPLIHQMQFIFSLDVTIGRNK